jgi:hypothetical protein
VQRRLRCFSIGPRPAEWDAPRQVHLRQRTPPAPKDGFRLGQGADMADSREENDVMLFARGFCDVLAGSSKGAVSGQFAPNDRTSRRVRRPLLRRTDRP